MQRRNLQVITEALSDKILFEGRRAIGVSFRREGRGYEHAPRGDHSLRRRGQLAAAVDAVGNRSARSSGGAQHSGRAACARRRAEPAGSLFGAAELKCRVPITVNDVI
jgi:hypothetical protein